VKLSEFKDERAIETLADVMEPVCAICADEKVGEMAKSGTPKLKLISYVLKNHAAEVKTCMAILDGENPEEYHCNMLTLPKKLLEILNDSDFMQLFTSAETEGGAKSSGSASENAE
jgi:hypothetical protein